MPSIVQPRWFGLNTRQGSSDISELEFIKLVNFNPFARPGLLVPDKGYTEKYSDNLTDCFLVGSARNDAGTVVTVANDKNELVYYVGPSGSQQSAGNLFGNEDRRALHDQGVIRISGLWKGALTKSSFEPKWFGQIDRGRFYYDSSGTGDLYSPRQFVDDYFMKRKGLKSPGLVTSGSPTGYEVDISTAKNGTGSAMIHHKLWYRFSFIYDGYQESPLSASDSPHIIDVDTDLGDDTDSIDVTLTLHEDLDERITGINIYRSMVVQYPVAPDSAFGAYKYLGTVYLDRANTEFPDDEGHPEQTFEWAYSSPEYSTTLIEYGIELQELFQNRIDYEETEHVSPHYRLATYYKDRMYVADVIPTGSETVSGVAEREKRWLLFSSLQQPDVIPETNLVTFPDDIIAVKATESFVAVWTRNEMFFQDEFRTFNRKPHRGCWSPDAPATDGRNLFWANRAGVWWWDGVRERNISIDSNKIDFDALTNGEVESLVGVLDSREGEYYLFVRGASTVFIYNIEGRGWRVRDMNMQMVVNDVNGGLIGTDGTNIHDMLSGYDYNGGSYSCQANTKFFDLDPRLVSELTELWSRHKVNGTGFSIEVYTDDHGLRRTLTFASQPGKTDLVRKSLMGTNSLDSLYGTKFGFGFKLSSPAEGDQIDKIAILHEVHNLL